MPTRNRDEMLFEALASILAQNWTSWECIVVDDGSSPVLELPILDKRLVLIRRDTPGGPAAARNAGVRAARGRYITFLDDDDLMAPGRLRLGVTALEANPTKNCHVGTLIRSQHPKLPSGPIKGQRLTEKQLRTGTPSVEMLMLEKTVVAPFDEKLRVGEDVEWWLRVEPSVRPIITDDVVSLVRLHPEARIGVSSRVRFDSRIYTYTRHRAAMPLFGAVRSRQQRRLAESALAVGMPLTAAKYALLALLTRPNLRKLKLLWQAFLRTLGLRNG